MARPPNYSQDKKRREEAARRKRDEKQQPKTVIFPRFHQLDATRKVVADVLAQGPGQRYLIQHSDCRMSALEAPRRLISSTVGWWLRTTSRQGHIETPEVNLDLYIDDRKDRRG